MVEHYNRTKEKKNNTKIVHLKYEYKKSKIIENNYNDLKKNYCLRCACF